MNDNLSLFSEEEMHSEGADSALTALRDQIVVCERCPLYGTRTQAVFGEGNSDRPDLAFVGEGPGPNEDAEGRPFVGREGKLLDKMIEAIGYERSDVYICTVVACKPPNNRRPEKEEMDACNRFLSGQLRIVRPKLIVAMGTIAAQALANSKRGIGELRGRWLDWKDKKTDLTIPFRATYHPAYLLRRPNMKVESWRDLQFVLGWLNRGKK